MNAEIVLWFVLGLVALSIGADVLVRGASALATRFGVSPLVVGLTVVAYGTSAPEMAVSISSAFDGKADVAFGNVVGSNIFNVLFILGVSALIAPLVVGVELVRKDVPVMIGAALLTYLLGADGRIGRFDGILLVLLAVAYTVWLIQASRRETAAAQATGTAEVDPSAARRPLWIQIAFVAVGLALLVLGSNWFVDSAIKTAKIFGLSDLVVGLTIVAAGTSLPEVATSVMASIKGEREIAVGNVVGSNIFNVFAVLGVSSAVAPNGVPVAPAAEGFDVPVMIAVCIACLPVFFSGYRIGRANGAMFLGFYVAYTAYLIMKAQAHDALEEFSTVMLEFVLPLTAITLFVFCWRQLNAPHRNSRKAS
jgi:cation:H+ antiporter